MLGALALTDTFQSRYSLSLALIPAAKSTDPFCFVWHLENI